MSGTAVLLGATMACAQQNPADLMHGIPGGPQSVPAQSVPTSNTPSAGTVTPQTSVGLNPAPYHLTPVDVPALSPGVLALLELEGRFSQEVEVGGGKAFARWFANDAVTLNNGQAAVLGRGAIAATATWDPKQYSLSWVALGAQMGPSNDMGFTWGHYESRVTDRNGAPVVTSGRYITVWKKQPDGEWKVALDASAAEPAPPPAAAPNP